MAATLGYSAGIEANQLLISYGQEVTWAVKPAVAFQAIRLTAESMTSTKTRDRPAEFNTAGEVQAAVTTQVSAGGTLTFALSFGTFDDLIAGALDNDWGTATTVTATAADLVLTAPVAGVSTLSSATAGKFATIVTIFNANVTKGINTWVRLAGFTNAANNDVFRVSAATALSLSLVNGGVTVAETPAGSTATVKVGAMLLNGASFRSFYFQKRLSSTLFLVYPGSYISDMMLTGGTGKFLNGTFTALSQSETSAVTDGSTGAVLAAPTGRVHDPVGGFGGVFVNGVLLASAVDSFTVNTTSNGAALEFALGTPLAQGVLAGLLEVKGTVKAFFKDLVLYTLFVNETAVILEFVTSDASGATYVIGVPQATLMNPSVVGTAQNTAVMQTLNIEGNPLPTTGTIYLYRL